MTYPLVTVFGGSGFVGRYVVQALARKGWRIRVAVRHPDQALFLLSLGAVGQIQTVQANITHPRSVAAALRRADAAINLVGILYQRGSQKFHKIQTEGAGILAKAASREGVKSLVQISAIGADKNASSLYAQSKAMGEEAVYAAFPKATILRPSLIFGPEDDFTNRFAALGKRLPFMPVIAGDTRFQPVYVGDVAKAVLAVLMGGQTTKARTYELGGPEIFTFRSLLSLIMDQAGIHKPLLDIPMPLARLQAALLQFLPKPPLTPDQLRLLRVDNVVQSDALTLKTLGITATPMEAILPGYFVRYRPKGQFSRHLSAG